MSYKISIIVPAYNVEKYLEKCLNSLINQTLEDIEIICINDGSTDKTPEILNKYEKKVDNLKVIHSENNGPGVARNKGLDIAKGEYILFVDSDDWIRLDTCEILYKKAKEENLDLLMFLIENYDENYDIYYTEDYYDNKILPYKYDNIIFSFIDIRPYLFSLNVTPCSKLYKRSMLEKNNIRYPKKIYFEDNAFYFEIILSSKRISIIRDYFLYRLRREDSVTGQVDEKYYDIVEMSNIIVNIFKKYNYYNLFIKQVLNHKITYLSRWFNLIEDEYKENLFNIIQKDLKQISLNKQTHKKYLIYLNRRNKNFYLSIINSHSLDEYYSLYEENSKCDTLIINATFPPYVDVSGQVLAKRVITSKKVVDVVYGEIDNPRDRDFNDIVDGYINKRIIIKNLKKANTTRSVNKFREEGIEAIEEENPEYKEVHSRSWTIDSHILALEYKLRHPEVKWSAEFSDPMLYDIKNNKRYAETFVIEDEDYIDYINKEIDNKNKKLLIKEDKKEPFPYITKKDDLYFLNEYLTYLFADKIVFTNPNQRYIMLKQFPYDVKDYVMSKSEIKRHPTLPYEYYQLKKTDYTVNKDFVNMGYFGLFLKQRNLQNLIDAIKKLDNTLRNKLKLHLFVPDKNEIIAYIQENELNDVVVVNEFVSQLEFLNLITKMDVLLVNDLVTKNIFEINPYLPSKVAEYIGSKRDIWALCEKNSPMDKMEFTYKSYIDNDKSVLITLEEIIFDKTNISKDSIKSQKKINTIIPTIKKIFKRK